MNESESGWYLKHRDGVEHGPFLLADLVSAAEAGNIADDTAVKHAAHSRDQWVLAKRIPTIAQAASQVAGAKPTSSPNEAGREKAGASPARPASKAHGPSPTTTGKRQGNHAAERSPSSPQPLPTQPAASGPKSSAPVGTRPTPSKAPATPRGTPQPAGAAATPRQPEPPKTSAPVSGKSHAESSANKESQTPSQSGKTAQASSPAARRSVFRRSDEMENSDRRIDRTRAGSATAEATTPQESESTAIANAPSIRGGRENPFPVPKTFIDACLALFDFRFRTFITPWIVKIVWAIGVAAAMMSAVKLGYDMFLEPSLGANPTATSTDPGWQFDPLAGQTLWQSSPVRFSLALLGIGLLLITLRVVCEGAIVFFYVANRVNDLKQLVQQREKS